MLRTISQCCVYLCINRTLSWLWIIKMCKLSPHRIGNRVLECKDHNLLQKVVRVEGIGMLSCNHCLVLFDRINNFRLFILCHLIAWCWSYLLVWFQWIWWQPRIRETIPWLRIVRRDFLYSLNTTMSACICTCCCSNFSCRIHWLGSTASWITWPGWVFE